MADFKKGVSELGLALQKKKTQYVNDKGPLEQQMLKNLRQHRGVYDRDILSRIPADKSRAYPRDTRTKIKAFVAKMMELMFPGAESNWLIAPTVIPSIGKNDLDQIIISLEQAEVVQASQEQRPPQALDSGTIESAVKVFAKDRAEKMQTMITDQLMDPGVDWPQTAKRVIRSGVIYGFGVVKAPLVRKQKIRTFKPSDDGSYEAVSSTERRPYPEFVKVWNIYPDLAAPSWEEQEGIFEREVFSKVNLRKLGKRGGFKKEAIDQYLMDNPQGNYAAKAYEKDLDALSVAESSNIDKSSRLYEVFRYVGYLSAGEMERAGVELDGKQGEVFADVRIIDDIVIYADLAPFGERTADVYHAYIYTEDEEAGLTGIGMPEELRDRQMSICAGTRALYDNMAITAGPMWEVAVDALKKNGDHKQLHAFKTIERDGEGSDLAYPAIRDISAKSHMPELQGILKEERQQFDIESNIPQWTMGNAQPLGEAFRTSANMSQMTGGANMVTKDHARSFDKFTTSVIGAFLTWNMEFGDDDIKGDFEVRPQGTISLVAKEVRGAALDQFVSTLSPEERALLKTVDVLKERLKSRDLSTDLIVGVDEAQQILKSMRENQSSAAQAEAGLTQAKTGKLEAEANKINQTLQAQIAEIMTNIESMRSGTQLAEDKQQLDSLQVMMTQVLSTARQGGGNEQGA